jgi:ABC-type proline/glycine betaine transport system substrate-binding protein
MTKKVEQDKQRHTPGVISGAPEGWAVPAPLAAPIVSEQKKIYELFVQVLLADQ